MPKNILYTDRLMRPIAHFSHASRIGDLVHVGAAAGVFPDLRLAGDSVGRADTTAQTRRMFDNLGTALGLMGSSLSELVRIKTYVADPRDIPLYLKIFDEQFGSQRLAHTVVGSWSFPLPQAAVELDAAAIVGGPAAAGPHVRYATALPVEADGQTAAPANAQIAAVLRNLEAALAGQGVGPRDVCNLHVTLADVRGHGEVCDALAKFFGGALPSCTFVEAPPQRLDFQLTLEAMAVRGGGERIGSPATPLLDGVPAPAVLAGDTLFLSGQTGVTAGPGDSGDVETQARIAWDRLHALLDAAGFPRDSMLRTNNVLTDWRHYAGFNAGYGSRIEAPYVPRATVLGKLADPRAKVQIEGIAHRQGADATILQVPPAAK